MKVGCARVSSKDQNLDRQIAALNDAGVDRIFADKQSGKDFERVEYKSMMKRLRAGDVLFIKSIDRLGRNYREIIEQWRAIVDKSVDSALSFLISSCKCYRSLRIMSAPISEAAKPKASRKPERAAFGLDDQSYPPPAIGRRR